MQRYQVGPWLPADMLSLLQVQDAVKCRVVDRQEEGNGDSGGSFQNGHAQLMVGLTAWRYKLSHQGPLGPPCAQSSAGPWQPY